MTAFELLSVQASACRLACSSNLLKRNFHLPLCSAYKLDSNAAIFFKCNCLLALCSAHNLSSNAGVPMPVKACSALLMHAGQQQLTAAACPSFPLCPAPTPPPPGPPVLHI